MHPPTVPEGFVVAVHVPPLRVGRPREYESTDCLPAFWVPWRSAGTVACATTGVPSAHWHWPPAHWTPSPPGHCVPQKPQLVTSVSVSTHVVPPPHSWLGTAHVGDAQQNPVVHVPASSVTGTWPVGQPRG